MEPPDYRQQTQVPDVDEYRDMRRVCVLSDKTEEAARRGLPNSLFATTIRDGDRLIAMGRVVGDGGCDFSVVDIAVHPDYQRQGLGKRVMTAIMAYLNEHAPESAYVALIADDHAPALYEKFGFKPTAPRSIGMAYRVGS
jgi:ribosomal protein S18 acetylase RimI-like enzyme